MRVRLTDICTPKQWRTIPTSELLSEGYPVYGANGIIGFYSEYNHESPVIAITCRGATCGTINITAPKSYVTGNAMCLDNTRPDVLLEYLYYCLLHYDFHNVISGSAQPQITRQGLEKVSIELHSLDEQRKIIDILNKLEAIILARKNELQKLDELVKARFVELFGDRNDPQIELIDLIIDGAGLSYGIVQPGEDGTGDMGVLRPVDMVDGKIATTSIKYIDRSIGDGFKKTELTGDELLITVRGTTGITALTDERFKKMNVTRGIAVVRYDRNKINPVYLNAFLNADESQRYIQEHTRGATLQQINLSDLRVQKIIVPPMELQERFAAFAEQSDKSKVAVQKALDEAQLLFDSLMQQYFG